MDKIAVIMPVWILDDETLRLTEQAIDSLGDVYMVIVDNGSDRGREYLESMADKYIRNDENKGYAIAVNQGLHHVTNEHPDIKYIAISNNDIRVSPNWQEVVRELMTDPKIYSLHFRMIPYDELFDYDDFFAKSGRERWCTGSFFVINIESGALFYDEDFKNRYDDWDYFYRVRDTGKYTAYTNKACYQHVGSHTLLKIPDVDGEEKRNSKIFKDKHGEYAETLFTRMYPDQLKIKYEDGFKIRR